MFKNELVRNAYLFASEMHKHQIYADEHPYMVHLFDVMLTLIEFGIEDQYLLAAALCHDSIEDTPANYADVKNHTNEQVADIVYALTDELGHNRRERKERTLGKLDGFPQAQFVKLADWISNVRQCYRNSHKMYQMYKKDYVEFSKYKDQSVDAKMSAMWAELDRLLSKNEVEFSNGMHDHHREFDG